MEKDNFNACLALLQAELAIFCAVRAAQERARIAVKDKQWEDYAGLTDTIAGYSAELERLETKRTALMNADKTGKFCFYAFITRFSAEERRALGSAYRAMKIEAARIRSANDALREHLNVQMNLVTGVLEAAFPDRRGALYGRYGKTRAADMRSVVVNRTF